MNITLKNVIEELMKADENYALAQTKLFPLEMKYQLRLDELQLASQRANQFQREAESRSIIMQEPLYTEYWEAKLNARLAGTRLETLREVSKALRNLAYNET
jgi:hypothetical protein